MLMFVSQIIPETESWAFLLVASFLFISLYIKLALFKKNALASFMIPRYIPSNFFVQNWLAFGTRATCLIVSFSLLVIFEARPILREDRQKTTDLSAIAKPKIDEVLFLLDSSTSMLAKDTSSGASRLERAKEIVEQVVERLGGINVSLVTFTGSAETIVPPTEDYLYFRILLDALKFNESGATGTNLLSAVEYINASEEKSSYAKSTLIVFLTDGEDTGFLDLSEYAVRELENSLLKKVEETVEHQAVWEVIGLGTTEGAEVPAILYNGKPVVSKMQKKLLQRIAEKGHGRFFDEHEMPLLSIIDNLLADVAIQGGTSQVAREIVVRHENWMPLLFAFILILAGILIPQGRKKL